MRRLRWHNAPDARIVQRLHDRIDEVLGDPLLPTTEEEAADSVDADNRYNEAVAALRERMRDSNRFRLLLDENMEYGFRRNALGVRPVALGIAGIVLALSAVFLAVSDAGVESRLIRWGSCGAMSLALLVFWWRVVGEDWVRRSAELYADRLLEALENLRRQS